MIAIDCAAAADDVVDDNLDGRLVDSAFIDQFEWNICISLTFWADSFGIAHIRVARMIHRIHSQKRKRQNRSLEEFRLQKTVWRDLFSLSRVDTSWPTECPTSCDVCLDRSAINLVDMWALRQQQVLRRESNGQSVKFHSRFDSRRLHTQMFHVAMLQDYEEMFNLR